MGGLSQPFQSTASFAVGNVICSDNIKQLPTPLESEVNSLDPDVLSTADKYGLVQLGPLSLHTVFEWGVWGVCVCVFLRW